MFLLIIREDTQEHGADTVNFVESYFYVDYSLCSVPNDAKAINMLCRTQPSFAESKFTGLPQTVKQSWKPSHLRTVQHFIEWGVSHSRPASQIFGSYHLLFVCESLLYAHYH